MSRSLGTLEQAVLRAVIAQNGDGYGMTIRQEVARALARDISIGAIYTTLSRLEEKGLVTSRLGEATEVRGGRAKRHFKIDVAGVRALSRSRDVIIRDWALTGAEAGG